MSNDDNGLTIESVDEELFRPPDDPIFQHLLAEAIHGRVPVFGVVIDASKLVAFDATHPTTFIRQALGIAPA